MADSINRMAITPTKVAQLTVPKFPDLPLDCGKNVNSVIRYNMAVDDWRRKLERMISQLPLKDESQ